MQKDQDRLTVPAFSGPEVFEMMACRHNVLYNMVEPS
jgi:hypothetical protein